MNCEMLAVLDAKGATVDSALKQVPEWFAQWEHTFSRFRPDSELNQLNASAGRMFVASADLWQLVYGAVQIAQDTQGLVTPLVLDALVHAGYDRSFEDMAHQSLRDTPFKPKPLALDTLSQIVFHPAEYTIILPANMRLDLGGFVKGWCADTAAQRLAHIAPALVDAGGDIAVSGMTKNGAPWPVAIADPINVEHDLCQIMLGACQGVATSGRDHRHWSVNGQDFHHIIDPRTGSPTNNNMLCATVMTSSAQHAEVASKMLMILGAHAGIEWLKTQSMQAYQALLVLDDGTQIRHALSDATD